MPYLHWIGPQATEINSRVLSAMAQRARADPMGKAFFNEFAGGV